MFCAGSYITVIIIHDTCHFSPEWEQLAPVSALFDGAEQLSMRGAGGHRVRHGPGWGMVRH